MQDVQFVQHKIKKVQDFAFLDFEDLDINDEEGQEGQSDQKADSQMMMMTTEEKDAIESGKTLSMDRVEDDCVIETKLFLKQARAEVYRKYADLCTELKLLYVAITRPKTMLLIYDTDGSTRKPLQVYWEKLGIIDTLTKEMM